MDINSSENEDVPSQPTNLLEIVEQMRSSGQSGEIDKSLFKSLSEILHQRVKDNSQFSDVEVLKAPIILKATLDAMCYKNDSVTAEALSMLGIYLDIEKFARETIDDSMLNLINELCHVIKTTCNKDACNKALFCIQKEKCFTFINDDMVDDLLAVMSVVIKQTNLKSFTAQNECINIVRNLLTKHQEKMCAKAEHWLHDLAPLVNHPAIRVRASILTLIDYIRFVSEPSKEILKKAFLEQLSLVIIPIMKDRFFKKQDTMMLILWCHVCDILGMAIHQGTAVLNSLLEIVERGFKSTDVKIKVETFHAWRHLIDNFALVPDVICNTKRLQLLLRPMLANNAQSPVIAKLKFTIWWHIVCKLGPKVSTHFQMVCNPLILFCFTHELPRNAADVASKIGPNTLFGATHQFLHQLGSQAICQLLCGDMPEQPCYGIDLLNMPAAVGSEIQLHNSDILLYAVEFITKDYTLPIAYTECIWKAIEQHLQYNCKKSEVVGIFNHLVQVVANSLNSPDVSASMKIKIFGIATNSLSKMPPPAAIVDLSKIKTLPVYILMKSLLNQQMITFQDLDHGCYVGLFKKLVHIGSNSFLGALGCSSLVVKNLSKAAQYSNDCLLLSQLWTEVCDLMMQYMSENGDMNEGDCLGHDFTCCYEVLLFPYLHIFSKEFPEKPKKEISKKCDHLYTQFLSSVAPVENVGVNTCVEELFQKMFSSIPKGHYATFQYLEELLLIIGTMIKSVDWHQLSQISSPPARKSMKRHSFGNLIPIFAEILSKVLESIRDATTLLISSCGNPTTTQKKMVNEVVNQSAYLVEHIVTAAPNDIIFSLLTNLIAAVELLFGITTSLKATFELNDEHVLYMWNGIISVLIRALDRKKQCPSSYFASIGPLVRAALTYPHEEIKKITFGLWKKIRSRSSVLILIPPLLRNTFEEMEDQDAKPALGKKPHRTKLNKSIENIKNNSPVKSKQKFLDNNADLEFVKISTPVKKRIYTEHQLEQKTSKKFIPAMYSDLTQDSSSLKAMDNVSSKNNILSCDSGDDTSDANEESPLLTNVMINIARKAKARASTSSASLPACKDRNETPVDNAKESESDALNDAKSPETVSSVPARKRHLRKNPSPSKRISTEKKYKSVGNLTLPLENLVKLEATNGKLESAVASTPQTRSQSLPPNAGSEDAKWGSGILKKRKSAGSILKASPPKRRVVSFADFVDNVNTETNNAKNRCPEHAMNKETDHGLPAAEQDTDSQATDRLPPVFPKLIACKDPVGSILSQLSPTMWTRGLSHFLKSRNIATVGDLSKMSSAEIEELPIKSPKLVVVEKVLSSYFESWNTNVSNNVVTMSQELSSELTCATVEPSTPNEAPTPASTPPNIAEPELTENVKVENGLQSQLPPAKKSSSKSPRKSKTSGYKRLKTQMWTRPKGATKQYAQMKKSKMETAPVSDMSHTDACIADLVAMSEQDLRLLPREKLTSMMLDMHKFSGNIMAALVEKDKLGQ